MLLSVENGNWPANHASLRAAFTGLKDVQLRQKWETESGVYLAESRSVIERAVQAGHAPLAFLLAPRWLDQLADVLTATGGDRTGGNLPVFLVPEDETELITGFRVHRGALALFRRPPSPEVDRFLAEATGPIAILEGLVDHTNVGAIFRSAAALGIDRVLVTPTCADPLYRRSVRVSMGAVFQVPWARLPAWPDLDLLHRHGYEAWALTPNAPAESLDEVQPGDKIALLLGSEGPGLTASTLNQADRRVAIPLDHEVDSLNVATAAAIAFWEVRRLSRPATPQSR